MRSKQTLPRRVHRSRNNYPHMQTHSLCDNAPSQRFEAIKDATHFAEFCCKNYTRQRAKNFSERARTTEDVNGARDEALQEKEGSLSDRVRQQM